MQLVSEVEEEEEEEEEEKKLVTMTMTNNTLSEEPTYYGNLPAYSIHCNFNHQ